MSSSRAMAQTGPASAAEAHTASPLPARGRMGPNAVTRLAEALAEAGLSPQAEAIFASANVPQHLATPPAAMVDERDVLALHQALSATLDMEQAVRIAARAGELTGDYLLANRIPRLAQRFLRALPRPLAAALLCNAIARHAWTFAGSGTFTHTMAGSRGRQANIAAAPLLAAGASADAYFAATFARIFQAMLGPTLRVEASRTGAGDTLALGLTW